MDVKVAGTPDPARIYSDATGTARPGNLTFMPAAERRFPLLLQGEAEEELRSFASTANEIYISEQHAAIDAVFEFSGELNGRKVALFADNEAARPVRTTGAAKNGLANPGVHFVAGCS